MAELVLKNTSNINQIVSVLINTYNKISMEIPLDINSISYHSKILQKKYDKFLENIPEDWQTNEEFYKLANSTLLSLNFMEMTLKCLHIHNIGITPSIEINFLTLINTFFGKFSIIKEKPITSDIETFSNNIGVGIIDAEIFYYLINKIFK